MQNAYTCKNCSTANQFEWPAEGGGRVCNGGKITLYRSSPENRGGGGRNSEQGITARQYGICVGKLTIVVKIGTRFPFTSS